MQRQQTMSTMRIAAPPRVLETSLVSARVPPHSTRLVQSAESAAAALVFSFVVVLRDERLRLLRCGLNACLDVFVSHGDARRSVGVKAE